MAGTGKMMYNRAKTVNAGGRIKDFRSNIYKIRDFLLSNKCLVNTFLLRLINYLINFLLNDSVGDMVQERHCKIVEIGISTPRALAL